MSSSARAANAMPPAAAFVADRSAALMHRPWTNGVAASDAAGPKAPPKLFAVQTWFLVGWSGAYWFGGQTGPVVTALEKAPGLVGFSVSNKVRWNGVIFETFSVWTDRESMGNFFRGDAHAHGMQAPKDKLGKDGFTFGVRRLWVPPSAVPHSGDYTGTRTFVSKVKQDAFEPAGPPGATPVTPVTQVT